MYEFSIHKRCQIDSHGDCGDRNFIYPWRRCSADFSSAKISHIILLLNPTCALHRQPLGVRSSSFLCAPSGSWLTKGCEGGFFVCDVGACLLKSKEMWKEFDSIYL